MLTPVYALPWLWAGGMIVAIAHLRGIRSSSSTISCTQPLVPKIPSKNRCCILIQHYWIWLSVWATITWLGKGRCLLACTKSRLLFWRRKACGQSQLQLWGSDGPEKWVLAKCFSFLCLCERRCACFNLVKIQLNLLIRSCCYLKTLQPSHISPDSLGCVAQTS